MFALLPPEVQHAEQRTLGLLQLENYPSDTTVLTDLRKYLTGCAETYYTEEDCNIFQSQTCVFFKNFFINIS